MRIGWLIAPADVVTKMTVLKTDGCTNVFGSHVVADGCRIISMSISASSSTSMAAAATS